MGNSLSGQGDYTCIQSLFDGESESYVARFTKRFWNNVAMENTGCWEWQLSTDSSGYGQVNYGGGTLLRAHRVAKFLSIGRPIINKQVNHTCNNKTCVNPEHLYLGDAKENVQDALDAGTFSTGEQNGRAKLSDDEVDQIRTKYETTDMTQAEIGSKYGVDQSTISDIVNGKIRKA